MKTQVTLVKGFEVSMEVAEDCIVFEGRCFCHEVSQKAHGMVREAVAAGKTKIVVIGDCDDHHPVHEEMMAKVMAASNMEHAWIGADDQIWRIQEAVPEFVPVIRSFSEVAALKLTMNTLEAVGQKMRDIRSDIEREQYKLKGYPNVFKVETLESHDHTDSAFGKLFMTQADYSLTSGVGMVCLLDPANKRGKLVTKSTEFEFTLARPQHFDFQELCVGGRGYRKTTIGSIRITMLGCPDFSLYLLPGDWEIAPHPELKPDDMKMRYIPMHQRIQKKVPPKG